MWCLGGTHIEPNLHESAYQDAAKLVAPTVLGVRSHETQGLFRFNDSDLRNSPAEKKTPSWWFQPISKILVKIGIFPRKHVDQLWEAKVIRTGKFRMHLLNFLEGCLTCHRWAGKGMHPRGASVRNQNPYPNAIKTISWEAGTIYSTFIYLEIFFRCDTILSRQLLLKFQ